MSPSGLLLVDKSDGWRSRQVVDAVAKRFRIRKIGHAGTLDPIATGLLVLLLGEGTKLSNHVMEGRKRYSATIRLGIETDTWDREGEVTAEASIEGVNENAVRTALAAMTGTILQRPPGYSAIKVDGRPLYKAARKGEVVEVEPREVTIWELKVLRVALPEVEIDVSCSKGTYMRAIAHDLGAALGVGGHLTQIRRLASAPWRVEDATPIEVLMELDPEALAPLVVPIRDALPHLPTVDATGELERRLANGMPIDGPLLYGRLPETLQRGDTVVIRSAGRLALTEVVRAPLELGPAPWVGAQPLRYLRVLHLDA